MSTGTPKFTLNLNETNSLGFTLTIEGSSSDVDATKPEFRFVLAERNGEKAWLYPMARDEEGDVVVQIPSEEFFSESKEYQGQVEVILGNHYFIPTAVDIEFVRPLKIEAAVSTKKSSMFKEGQDNKPVNVSSVTVKSKNKVQKETARSQNKPIQLKTKAPTQKPGKRKWDDLTKEEQEKIKNMLRERKATQLRKAKLEEAKKAKEAKELARKKAMAEKKVEKSVKDQLKNLMSDSLLDE